MNRRHRHEVDDASLQADVMRFMAIVAFCLVAILAMVRNISAPEELAAPEPVEPARAERMPVDEVPVEAPPVPKREPVDAPPPPQKTFVVQRPAPSPQPIAAQPVVVLEPESAPEPMPVQEVVREVVQSAPEPEEAAPQPQRSAAEDVGLTLRFESESDFLRLVARGKVTVYAFDASHFVELDRNYRFREVTPPGQVYELEVETIPRHLRNSLPSELADLPLNWAVGLPQRVRRQIERYLREVDNGELLIDRFEQVHHVAAR